MKNIYLKFNKVSKIFNIKQNPTTLKSLLVGTPSDTGISSGVKDITFEAGIGDIVGLFGPNGSGKSTILRLAAGIVNPDRGSIVKNGSVASVLELGSGLHPELTGTENIWLYGSILGLDKNQIKKSISKVVDFSGLNKYINVSVKYYSSGMKARLASSIVLYSDADIMLFDEALSVGDIDFRFKFLQKIFQLRKNKIIVFSSHDLGMVHALSDKVLMVDGGVLLNTPNEIGIWRIKLLSMNSNFSVKMVSNSMHPFVKKGQRATFKKLRFDSLKIGDVIAFVPDKIPMVVVHRISGEGIYNGSKYYITKGDATSLYDSWKVRKSNYLGRLVFNSSPL